MALLDDFKGRFPEFPEDVADTYVPPLDGVWQFYYGGNYDVPREREAALNLVAHLALMDAQTAKKPNATGYRQASSKSVGSVSVSYTAGADGTMSDGFYSLTRYGQRFLMLSRHRVGPAFV